ncbi:hypothetical protein DV736_g3891, partial [Chaetothyriales sp. CBS 134916]
MMSISAIVSLDKDELRSIQYYRELTSNNMSGFFDSEFWARGILRLSYSNDAMRHFVLTLSSLDEAYRLRARPDCADLAVSRHSFALQNYSKAIQALLAKFEQQPDNVIVLASCLACICIELWLGFNENARNHSIAGFQFAQAVNPPSSHPSSQSESNALISQHLLPTLRWHIFQLGAVEARNRGQFLRTWIIGHSTINASSTVLASYDEARDRCFALVDRLAIVFEKKQCEDLSQMACNMRRDFHEWHDQVIKLSKIDGTAGRKYSLLHILYYEIIAQLSAIVLDDDRCYEHETEAFENIVKHVGDYIECDDDRDFQNASHRSNDAVTVTALFLVVWRSRRLEGPWHSIMVGVMGEALMMLEERSQSEGRLKNPYLTPRRLILTKFEYSPGVLATGDRQQDWTEWQRSPTAMSMEFIDPNTCSLAPVRYIIRLKPYFSSRGFGMKSLVWWPKDDNFPIMNEVIAEETKYFDGRE